MNQPNYFEVQADDIERAKHFYTTVFGWRFTKADGLPIEYWRIETEGMNGGLLARPAAVPPTQSETNAFVCSMQIENFDATAEMILNLNGQIALPKFAVPGLCWQGYFIDTESNTFGLFQVDTKAQ